MMNRSLFGRYLREANSSIAKRGGEPIKTLNPKQLTKLIPPKSAGRPPSASSQTGLYHDEDFNFFSKVTFDLNATWKKVKPNVFRKDFYSKRLNTEIRDLRVTTSALHAMDDVGGFDNYILHTPPAELRSTLGENMRNVMYFYMDNPEIRKWGLPWKVFASQQSRDDPYFARYKHLLGKQQSEKKMKRQVKRYSPYYLPSLRDILPVQQAVSGDAVSNTRMMNLWWTSSKSSESQFRSRLGEANSFDPLCADHRNPEGYRKGEGRGGGGQHGTTLRKRSKNYKFNQIRRY